MYAIQEFEDWGMTIGVFAPDKKNADRLMEQYCKKTGYHSKFIKIVMKKYRFEQIKRYGLTIDNYYQKQLDEIMKMERRRN